MEVLAWGDYTPSAGGKRSIALELSRAGRTLLKDAAHHRLRANTIATVGGGRTVIRVLTLYQ